MLAEGFRAQLATAQAAAVRRDQRYLSHTSQTEQLREQLRLELARAASAARKEKKKDNERRMAELAAKQKLETEALAKRLAEEADAEAAEAKRRLGVAKKAVAEETRARLRELSRAPRIALAGQSRALAAQVAELEAIVRRVACSTANCSLQAEKHVAELAGLAGADASRREAAAARAQQVRHSVLFRD
jgi:colicin import membrane protein